MREGKGRCTLILAKSAGARVQGVGLSTNLRSPTVDNSRDTFWRVSPV